jgi:2-haloacid dehalogenase
MPYSWLFFDADGTLYDFDLGEKTALGLVSGDLGHTLTDETYQSYQSVNKKLWEDFERGDVTQAQIKIKRFERWLEALGISADANKISHDYLIYLSQQSALLDHALDVIQTLSKTYNLLLMTNGLKEVQRPRFNASPLRPYIRDIIVSGEVGFAKPDPRIFDAAFEKIGRPHKREVLMIGDSLSADIQGGMAYGLDTCWYNPNGNSSSLNMTHTIQDLRELLTLL